MSETTCNDTISDSKLLATMPGHLHISRVHTAVNCHMAIWAFIFPPFDRTGIALACIFVHTFVPMATFFFNAWGLDVFLQFEQLHAYSLVFCWTCFACVLLDSLVSFVAQSCLPCWRQSFFFLFSGFRRQRFGRFCGCGFAWLGHATCWGSGFSHALPKHFFLKFCLVACRLPSLSLHKVDFLAGGNLFSFFLVGSVGNVSLRD